MSIIATLSAIAAATAIAIQPGLIGSAFRLAGRLPGKFWLAVLAVVLLAACWFSVKHVRAMAYQSGQAAGAAAEQAKWTRAFEKMHRAADLWRQNYETAQKGMTNALRLQHASNLRDIADRADDLRLRGPGQAAHTGCGQRTPAAASPAARGYDAAGRPGNAPLDQLPDAEPMAIVPWRDLIRFAEQADGNRDEALTWRNWKLQTDELDRKARTKLPGAPSGASAGRGWNPPEPPTPPAP